ADQQHSEDGANDAIGLSHVVFEEFHWLAPVVELNSPRCAGKVHRGGDRQAEGATMLLLPRCSALWLITRVRLRPRYIMDQSGAVRR
ncbi:MAG: hypothetical protein WBN68_21700, partial [Sedimenticolaceae bacterium]